MNDSLVEIINQCLVLEKMAIRVYHQLCKHASDQSLKSFWENMAHQESDHVSYWKKLKDLAQKGKILNIFDNPKQILDDLKNIKSEIDTMLSQPADLSNLNTAFLLAYRVEFSMMHPAFEAMFHLMQRQTGDPSPEKDYEHHIQGLLKTMQKYGPLKPEFELIADLMEKLWDRNRQLAFQLADIKDLRGLIPICMHCKNIRDDEGFWGKVETYIENFTDVEFSHGLCPDCAKKYYSDFFKDGDLPE